MKVLTSKEIPILFSTPMIQAILAGRKTQTRRVVKSEPLRWLEESGFTPEFVADPGNSFCPYGHPGDILWVRETWFPAAINGSKVMIGYNVDEPKQTIEITTEKVDYYWKQMDKGRYIPSIHMPKEAARIWLEVTDVRAERLQDISEQQAIAEGIEKRRGSTSSTKFDYKHYRYDHSYDVSAEVSFRTLWEKINGPETWNANPWVWVVSFKVLSTTGKPNKQ